MRKQLAVVTMCYNEADLLPIWERHYIKEVGAENCYVIDHGSEDGSVDKLSAAMNIDRLPRSVHEDVNKVEFVRGYIVRLLSEYERVLVTDTDEFAVADPRDYEGLVHFTSQRQSDVITLFGLNILHLPQTELDVDPKLPIIGQRLWAQAYGSLCKPTLIRRPAIWCAGFHLADAYSVFDNIYLFHLAYMDTSITRRRQEKRNRSPSNSLSDSHHLLSSDDIVSSFNSYFNGKPVHENADLRIGCPLRDTFEASLYPAHEPREVSRITKIDAISDVWRIPDRFHGLL